MATTDLLTTRVLSVYRLHTCLLNIMCIPKFYTMWLLVMRNMGILVWLDFISNNLILIIRSIRNIKVKLLHQFNAILTTLHQYINALRSESKWIITDLFNFAIYPEVYLSIFSSLNLEPYVKQYYFRIFYTQLNWMEYSKNLIIILCVCKNMLWKKCQMSSYPQATTVCCYIFQA